LLDDDKKSGGVADHLAAPRKKKKDYIVFAISDNFDPNLASVIEGYVRLNYKSLSLVHPKSSRDLQKLLNREIVLILIEDKFVGLDKTISLIKSLKVRKREKKVPVLFLTDDLESLVKKYHEELAPYHETDTYIEFRKLSEDQMFAKINNGIKHQNARKSRRYKVDVDLTYHHLTKNDNFRGKLIDMSVHGAVLQCVDNEVFRPGDQIRINLPISKYVETDFGDFIKISAKVRRVFIGGNKVAISWEYLSENQLFYLTSFVTEMVNQEMLRSARMNKTIAALQARRK